MDYKEIFDSRINALIRAEGENIKNYFLDSLQDEKSYISVKNHLSYNYYEKMNLALKKDDEVKLYYDVFIESLGEYKGDLDNKIKNSLKKSVNKLYNKRQNKIKSFKGLVKEIASIYGLKEVNAILTTLDDFFKDMYNLEDFNKFKFERFDYQYSEEWEKVHKKRFPDKISKTKTKVKKDYTHQINDTKEYFKTFNDLEKKIILKAFYSFTQERHSQKKPMKITEFIKVTTIISDFDEPDIFYKRASSSNIYSKLKESHYSDNEKRIISNTVKKLRKQKIIEFSDYLAEIGTGRSIY